MKQESWDQLLSELRAATEQGRLRWRRTDVGGSFIAAFHSSSVVVRGVNVENLPVVMSGVNVEVRGADGEVLAAIGTGAASVLPKFTSFTSSDPVHSTADPHTATLIDDLVAAIRRTTLSGEDAAQAILDELRSDDTD